MTNLVDDSNVDDELLMTMVSAPLASPPIRRYHDLLSSMPACDVDRRRQTRTSIHKDLITNVGAESLNSLSFPLTTLSLSHSSAFSQEHTQDQDTHAKEKKTMDLPREQFSFTTIKATFLSCFHISSTKLRTNSEICSNIINKIMESFRKNSSRMIRGI